MPKTQSTQADAPRKRGVRGGFLRKVFSREATRRHWFDHPEMQARVAEAEADFLNGRSYRTGSADEMQALLDEWK